MLAEDLSAYFADFGELVIYNGTPDVPMIFDNAFFEDRLGRVSINSAQPVALAQAASVPNPVGKLIVRDVITYKVVSQEPDGTGLVLLHLEKQ